jgi:capsule polysaccharide export protein KpsC/LpsZ
LAWHLHGDLSDVWHLKNAYLPDYFYFDKHGYSGWSDLAQEYEYDVDIEDIRDEMQSFCNDYIASNRSRVHQPQEAFIPKEPYVLVLLQRTNDNVMTFAHMDNQVLLNEVTELYKDTEYTVCVKSHPLADTGEYPPDDITMSPEVFHATGSVHKIIAGATAVYTVNSGSGFEALLHGKRVFTSGDCDYHWVTTPVKNKQDLQDTMHLIEEPVDKDEILKFLHYAVNEYFVNINDEQTIKQRIEFAMNEYAATL